MDIGIPYIYADSTIQKIGACYVPSPFRDFTQTLIKLSANSNQNGLDNWLAICIIGHMNEITQFNSAIESVLIRGDLSKLAEKDRVEYYMSVCKSLGLNPLTRPFEYIVLNGRLTLYATRAATDQLRTIHGVSVEIVSREERDGLYIVHARARNSEGRVDESIGIVPLTDARGQRLTGDLLANAMMKAETKAKRRVTLSICGLGWLDETEIETIPDAQRVETQVHVVTNDETSHGKHALEAGNTLEAKLETSTRERFAAFVKSARDKLSPSDIEEARQIYRENNEQKMIQFMKRIGGDNGQE